MSNPTLRDECWLVIIDHLRTGRDLHTDDITTNVDVSAKTARSVLNVAQGKGLLARSSPRAQTWHTNIGPLNDVADPEYRRAIRTLINESRK